MKAVVCRAWGSPSSVTVEDLPSRRPAAGEVRVAVHAAGVNPVDVSLVAGRFHIPQTLPCVPGFEAAGVVVECGDGVRHVRPYDRVAVTLVGGGFAEEVTTRSEAVVPLPDGMDFLTAAASVVAYGTAHVALNRRAGLRPGGTLLVHGGAGNVGSAAVEVGKRLGATVIATATADNRDGVIGRGAAHVIDYRTEDIVGRVLALTSGRGADVVFDTVGGDAFDASFRCLAWEGRIVFVGVASGRGPTAAALELLSRNVGVIGMDFASYTLRDVAGAARSLAETFGWHAEGGVRRNPPRTLPLDRAGEALSLVASGKAGGKVVLLTGAE